MNKKEKSIVESRVSEMLNLINNYKGDTECLHYYADAVLLNCLRDLGLLNLVEAYEKIEDSCSSGFWYA